MDVLPEKRGSDFGPFPERDSTNRKFGRPFFFDRFLEMAGRVTQPRRQLPHLQEQQPRARWTTSLTKVLADLMVEQVQKGNRRNNSFGKKAWSYMCDEFHKKTGLRWDKEQLKNRYAVLRRQFGTVRSLLDRNDFTWDETTGIIVADEELWIQYIKGHPDAESIKSSGCPIYKELCVIFAEPKSNGNGKLDQSNENSMGTHFSNSCAEQLSMNEEDSSSESDELDDYEQETTQPATPSMTGSRKRGRKGVDEAIAGAILEMAAASRLRTAAVQQRETRYTIADCIKELDEMIGVKERVYFIALDLFIKPAARETFLSLKGDKRLIWLLGKCTAR